MKFALMLTIAHTGLTIAAKLLYNYMRYRREESTNPCNMSGVESTGTVLVFHDCGADLYCWTFYPQ